MQDDHIRDSGSVYQNTDEPAPPRAFHVDVREEETDSMRHAYYGVTGPNGQGGLATSVHGAGVHLIRDAHSFADRLWGELVWL